jgi:hypothetical protein
LGARRTGKDRKCVSSPSADAPAVGAAVFATVVIVVAAADAAGAADAADVTDIGVFNARTRHRRVVLAPSPIIGTSFPFF